MDFAVGGQAVIEGVMMRSPHYVVIAVRTPTRSEAKRLSVTHDEQSKKKNLGSILIKEIPFESWTKRLHVSHVPIIRGMVGLVESLYIGIKALNFSNDVFLSGETRRSHKELLGEKKKSMIEALITIFSIVAGLGLTLLLFKWLPLFLTDLLSGIFPKLNETYIYFNLIDGFLKTLFFLIYLLIISQLPDIKRVFQYHGAEHKSIMTYEAHSALEPKVAKKYTRFHPRCGTSFIIIVIMLSIFIYTFIPTHDEFWLKFLERVGLLPLIAGVSYELLKYSAKHMDNRLIRQFVKPGLAFQRITTSEPDLSQLEVGLASLKRALKLEETYRAH